MKKKFNKIIFTFILLAIPFLFFVILEVALRTFNYGIDNSTWIKINNTHFGLNPKVATRYFNNTKTIPEPIQDVFTIKKLPNTYRIFVLGGSSAAGFPYMPLGSFSRYLRQRLETNFQKTNFEVVNLGLSAVNSYTLLDFLPDVLEQTPDLILIYSGHNEYYGALGVGSMESFGQSRTIVKLLIELNKYKTIQLLKNFFSSFANNEERKTGTLMSRIAKNKSIELDSEIFNKGIKQFENNLSEIFSTIKNKNVPIIVSTLVSNLKDQPPFNSENNLVGDQIYKEALKEYKKENYERADSLFKQAKDLDQIRFRAPKKINDVIVKLADQYNIPVIQTDSILNKISPNGIIGNNLLIDHLHLSLEGNQKLGRLFYDKMNDLKLLPKSESKYLYSEQDSITCKNFYFSDLDSTIADFQIKLLKNDWPFINQKNKQEVKEVINLSNAIDTIALSFIQGKETWEKSHRIIANKYFENGNIEKGKWYYEILIHQYPLANEYYKFISEQLINKNKYSDAIQYLEKGNKLQSNEYFTKWLGIINLSQGKVDESIIYLEQSMKFNSNDPQVIYNLSGAFINKKNYKHALKLLEKCLLLNPNYQSAISLKEQLEKAIKH